MAAVATGERPATLSRALSRQWALVGRRLIACARVGRFLKSRGVKLLSRRTSDCLVRVGQLASQVLEIQISNFGHTMRARPPQTAGERKRAASRALCIGQLATLDARVCEWRPAPPPCERPRLRPNANRSLGSGGGDGGNERLEASPDPPKGPLSRGQIITGAHDRPTISRRKSAASHETPAPTARDRPRAPAWRASGNNAKCACLRAASLINWHSIGAARLIHHFQLDSQTDSHTRCKPTLVHERPCAP